MPRLDLTLILMHSRRGTSQTHRDESAGDPAAKNRPFGHQVKQVTGKETTSSRNTHDALTKTGNKKGREKVEMSERQREGGRGRDGGRETDRQTDRQRDREEEKYIGKGSERDGSNRRLYDDLTTLETLFSSNAQL